LRRLVEDSDMRVVGYVLVALAMACGPMGVQMQATQTGPGAVCAGSEAAVCEASSEGNPEPSTAVSSAAAREDFIPLNTRGYNYSRPDTFRPEIPSTVTPGER
jgi:hypothetical protein